MSTELLEIPGPDGFPIRVRTLSVASPRGAVVICHGFKGFSQWGFFPWLSERVAAMGMRVVAFDFSGSGMTAGGSFSDQEGFYSNTFSRELRDLETVLAESRRRKWITGAYGLFGHSRGGGIATLHAGSDANVKALVTWAAISTVRRWSDNDVRAWRERGHLEVGNARTGEILRQGTAILDEVEREADGALDIAAAAGRITAPWLIVHGTEDETVSAEEGRRLHACAAAGVARIELLETSHTFGISHPMIERSAALDRAVALTVDFYSAHLR